MNKLLIFVVRVIIGTFFAIILTRFFHPDAKIIHMAGLGVFMVGLAYLLEYWRTRKSEK